MAAIREELVLADRFSATFSRYLTMGRQAASAAAAAGASQTAYNANLSQLGGAASQAGSALNELGRRLQEAGQSSTQAADKQEKINRKFQEGVKSADALTGKLKGLIATYLSFQGVKRALDWVGENLKLADIQRNAENQLRAVLMNMGAQEVTIPVTADLQVDTAQTMSAFDAITQKASEIQGRGIYGDEAMIAGAAELATYFEDANAIMSMMDTLADYTMGMTGGGAVGKEQMVQYATDIGKIMSGSYIAMTKKGFEFTEAQKAIVEGTATEKQIVEALGKEYLDMSADMQAAAAINAVIAESWGGLYDAMSDTPEGKIIQFQNRLGDLREVLGNRIYPAVLQVVDVFNNGFGQIEQVLTAFSDVCAGIVTAISWIAEAALNVASVIVQNGDLVMSVLIGIASAFLVVKAASVASAIASAVAWAVAHWQLVLLGAGLALIAAAVTGVIQRTLQMGGTWEEVCGVMGSVLYELYAVIYNVVADAWNLFAIFAEFFANFLNDPIRAICRLVFDAFDWILGIIESVAGAIDALFGQNFSSAVAGFRSDIKRFASDAFGKNEITVERMNKIDYGDAWQRGNELGRKFYNSVSELGNMSINGFDSSALNGIPGKLDDIGGDTKAIKNSVSLSEEDIKLLVDLAEREYITNVNLTAQTPIITINNQSSGNNEIDNFRLANAIKTILIEEAASHTDQSYT